MLQRNIAQRFATTTRQPRMGLSPNYSHLQDTYAHATKVKHGLSQHRSTSTCPGIIGLHTLKAQCQFAFVPNIIDMRDNTGTRSDEDFERAFKQAYPSAGFRLERLPMSHYSDMHYDAPNNHPSFLDSGLSIYRRRYPLSDRWQAEQILDQVTATNDSRPVQTLTTLVTNGDILQAVQDIEPSVTSLADLPYVTEIFTHRERFSIDDIIIEFDYFTLGWDCDYWKEDMEPYDKDTNCIGRVGIQRSVRDDQREKVMDQMREHLNDFVTNYSDAFCNYKFDETARGQLSTWREWQRQKSKMKAKIRNNEEHGYM